MGISDEALPYLKANYQKEYKHSSLKGLYSRDTFFFLLQQLWIDEA